jgi:hypothetical protein
MRQLLKLAAAEFQLELGKIVRFLKQNLVSPDRMIFCRVTLLHFF